MIMLRVLLLSVLLGGAVRASEQSFLFAYFLVNGEDGLHLAGSKDGLTFTPLAKDRSFLRPLVGEQKIMRDPCLFQGPDGKFHLVWTTAWAGKTIGYANSSDLVNWSEQQAIPVMAHEPEAQNCWAPEITWDDREQAFVLFWSTTILGRFPETAMSNRRPERNHRIYACTTKDFKTYTPTRLLYDGGYNVIDASFSREGERWRMWVKNETFQPQTEQNIRLVVGETLWGPFGEPSPALTGAYWAEGPSALKVGSEWWVYFDKHMLNAYGLVVSKDLKTWEDRSAQVSFPKDARHGTVLAVPAHLLQQLDAAVLP